MAEKRQYPTGVRPGARGGIEIRWKYKGKPYSEHITAEPTAANLKQASKTRKARIDAQHLEGTYGILDTGGAPVIKLFGDVAQEYLDQADLEATTYGNYKNALNKYWMPRLAALPVGMIGQPDIKNILASIDEVSRKTQRNILIPLRQVFKFALIDKEYIAADPTINIHIKKGQKPQPDPFTLDERNAILSQLTDQALFFFTVAFETGMRCPSEILALQWQDFDGKVLSVTKARVIRKLKPNTKTNEARRVMVTKTLCKMLMAEKMKSASEWMFVNSLGNPCLDADLFNAAWKVALKATGIRYRRAYNCRHTYASLGLKAKMRPAFLASQLGHSLQMFYTTYAKWISEDEDLGELALMEQYTQGGG